MIISATGIVFDHHGDVLLIKRDDTRTLAPPGGAAEIDELPPETAVREVKEETGLIVMPTRLVGLYHLPTRPHNFLTFCFRCIMRGGELETSKESLQAGFFKTDPSPSPMLAFSKERVQRSLKHQGGPPYWGVHKLSPVMRIGNIFLNTLIYPSFDLRRRIRGEAPHVAPPQWEIEVYSIIRDPQGRILWVNNKDQNEWTLPGGRSLANEPPWETAARTFKEQTNTSINLKNIRGAYPIHGRAKMIIIFQGELPSAQVSNSAVQSDYFTPGDEPAGVHVQHKGFIPTQDQFDIEFKLLTENPA